VEVRVYCSLGVVSGLGVLMSESPFHLSSSSVPCGSKERADALDTLVCQHQRIRHWRIMSLC
jgi:hypothetical protein